MPSLLNNIYNTGFILFLLFISMHLSCNKAVNYTDPEGPKYNGSYSDNTAGSDSLKVVTFNTKHSGKPQQIILLFNQNDKLADADIILMQEADEKSSQTIAEALKYNYTYIPSAVHHQSGKNFGNAILSKWDIIETDKVILPNKGKFNDLQRVVLKSLIDINGRIITVYNVHLSTPFQLSADERFQQAELIFNDGLNSDYPVIIAGDFNDRDIPGLALNHGYEWPTEEIGNTTFIFSWDHVLTSDLEIYEPGAVGVVTDNLGASDHKPVWAKFVLSDDPEGFGKVVLASDETITENNHDVELLYKKPPGSLGQPIRYKPYFGMSMLLDRRNDNTKIGGIGYLGIYRDLINPVTGVFGISAEAYIGGSSTSEAVGLRLLASSPVLHLHTGLDYEITDNKADLIVSFTPPLRRGGLFHAGDFLRIDWLPTRSNTFLFGFQFPLFQRAGQTRPFDKKVTLPEIKETSADIVAVSNSEVEEVLSIIREAGKYMIDYNTFYEDTSGSYEQSIKAAKEELEEAVEIIKTKTPVYLRGKGFNDVVDVYHLYLDRLFTQFLDIDDESMEKLLVEVRLRLLDDVIIPYDRTIGQIKRYDSVLGLGEIAGDNLSEWIDGNLSLDDLSKNHALNLFDKLVNVIEDCREHSLTQWDGDSRQVWLMYQYAIKLDEHDTQEELDSIIEKSLDYNFTESNAVYVITSIDFIKHLKRSIKATEDYHVLWVHDYRGIDSFGNPDEIGFDLTINSYLEVLTQRVREYDQTGKLPVFIIILDQFFYEIQKGRIWLSLLEDPLNHTVKLPDGFEDMENKIIARQNELREAVSNSNLLSAEAEKFGPDYIKDKVKIHINITQPPDFSFLSPGIVKGVPFLPDNIMIDHRKMAFYDITEQDPYKGEAIFTGTGIGEHYVTPTWEDRGILTSGPAISGLKKMAREVLLKNYISPLDMPDVLKDSYKAAPNPRSSELRNHKASDARGLIVENSIGYGDKYSTFLHSILYTLSPPGTTMILPDSLWLGEYWAGLVIGAAARGCNVYVIGPSDKNAPSPGSVQMWRAKVVTSKLLLISNMAREVIEMNGGHLRIGIYNRTSDVGNVKEVLRETVESYQKYSFLKEEFPVSDTTFKIMEEIADELEAGGYKPDVPAEDKEERLVNIHRKTRFFGTKEMLRALASVPEPKKVVYDTFDIFIRESLEQNPGSIYELEGMDIVYPLISDYEELRKSGKFSDSILYYSIGSMNHDPRGMALDGEVSYLISGPWALWGYIDSLFLLGQVEWVTTQEELEQFLEGKNERMRRLGHWIRNIL